MITTCRLLLLFSIHFVITCSTQLYVVPSINDNKGDGSFEHPYSTIHQALDHVERLNAVSTTINLFPTYYFENTISITQMHSHMRLTTMNTRDTMFFEKFLSVKNGVRKLSTAVISGGVSVKNWTKLSGNTYSANVPQLTNVNQLFANNHRIVRSRFPTNYSDYLHYQAPLNDSKQARYGFQYKTGQFNYSSLADAMVVVYNSWTESHHYIDRLIPENNTVLFTNPSYYFIGEFPIQSQNRFQIENLCEALIPNSFCFINETKTIYLMTDGSYDPTSVDMITPIHENVLSIIGNNATQPVENITMDYISIQHGAWNIATHAIGEGSSARFLKSVALFIANSSSIRLSNIEISHTGSYGLRIGEGTSNIIVIDSLVTDTGAGGIWIGEWSTPVSLITSSINISSNEISFGGNVFPSGVGVLVNRAFNITIENNVVHHHRNIGINVGAALGYNQSFTNNIHIRRNYIHNIGQHVLNDLGGIHLVGIQPGTIIDGNVIKNVFSYAVFMWGIYLDEGTSDIIVSNNIVYNTGWGSIFQHYGANNTIMNNIFARSSLIPQPATHRISPDGDCRIDRAENHTSWTFIRNIVYDTFQGTNHSAYMAPVGTTVVFGHNLYYSVFNTSLRFGSQQLSFDQWQKTGQDNGSVIADPLFLGDVNQCDFFTIRSDSPAAKLGFVNITKPSKWTSGCSKDDSIINNQFYHW